MKHIKSEHALMVENIFDDTSKIKFHNTEELKSSILETIIHKVGVEETQI